MRGETKIDFVNNATIVLLHYFACEVGVAWSTTKYGIYSSHDDRGHGALLNTVSSHDDKTRKMAPPKPTNLTGPYSE